MLIDKNTLFSDKQKLTESAPSQHLIDMGAAGNAASGWTKLSPCVTRNAIMGVAISAASIIMPWKKSVPTPWKTWPRPMRRFLKAGDNPCTSFMR